MAVSPVAEAKKILQIVCHHTDDFHDALESLRGPDIPDHIDAHLSRYAIRALLLSLVFVCLVWLLEWGIDGYLPVV